MTCNNPYNRTINLHYRHKKITIQQFLFPSTIEQACNKLQKIQKNNKIKVSRGK